MLVSYNVPQFAGKDLKWFLEEFHIEHHFVFVRYAHTNGQVEATNKVVMDELKKKVDALEGNWANDLENVLWQFE